MLGNRNISYGVTRETYLNDIEPGLTRPMTLGGVRRRQLPEHQAEVKAAAPGRMTLPVVGKKTTAPAS